MVQQSFRVVQNGSILCNVVIPWWCTIACSLASDNEVTRNFVRTHVLIGIEALEMIRDEKRTVRHLKYDF